MGKNKKPLNGTREVRAFALPDISSSEEGNVVEGHAAVFGQEYDMGFYTETIARDAFNNTDFTDVIFDVNHNLKSLPLARSRNNNADSTLQLKIDNDGLYTRAALDIENNSDSKALYSSVKRGDINGMSYIFCVREDKWEDIDTDNPKRTITDISKVYEVSAVSMPANPGTDINARSQEALESAKKTLESVRAKSLESDKNEQRNKNELEIEKLKTSILMKG